jgi:hypothetical protein
MSEANQNTPGEGAGKNSNAGAGNEKSPGTDVAVRTSSVLAGTENYKANETQVGLALRMTSSGVPSTLMIPDVTKVAKGGEGAEVYITKPISLEGKNLKRFLINKKILTLKNEADKDKPDPEVKEAVGKFLSIVEISLEAFYFNKTGPWLMQFNLNTEAPGPGNSKIGIIGTMTDDPDLGLLFDVLGASVRVFKCNDAAQYKVLQRYAADLLAE